MGYYKDKLYRVFFGNPPKFMLEVPEDISVIALKKQGVDYTYGDLFPSNILSVNFPRLIQDVGLILKERGIYDDLSIPIEVRQSAMGVFYRSEFVETIQDTHKDNWQKIFLSFYFRSYLTAIDNIYKCHVIDNQPTFINELLKAENYYSQLVATELHGGIKEDNNKRFKLSMSRKQKNDFATELKDHNITSTPKKMIAFLDGNNNSQFVINENKLHHIAYLIFKLKENKLIDFVGGKGYFLHFQSLIYHYSGIIVKKDKNGMTELKRQVMDARFDKKHVQSEIDRIIAKLNGR